MLLETRALILRRGARDLLRDLDWTIRAGERWVIVGPNGVGKSTLLAALANDRAQGPGAIAEGRVVRAPGVWIAWVGQQESDAAPDGETTLLDLARATCGPILELGSEVDRRGAALGASPSAAELEAYGAWQAAFAARGGYGVDARLAEALERLGLGGDAGARRVAVASGGERRRARLAGALVSGADVLVLDEPTNHLDLATRVWLAQRLARWPGAVIAASHDRAWIDDVATHVLWWSERGLRALHGGYASARRAVDEAGRTDAKAERLRRRRAAELDAMAAELRAHGHRGAARRRRRAERERAALPPPATATRSRSPAWSLDTATEGGELARLTHLTHGDRVRDAALVLRAGDRFALVGASGSGKTTLLRLIAGEVEGEDPRERRWWRTGVSVWHVDQLGRGIADDATPLGALAAWVGPGRAEGVLAQVRLPRAAWERPAATLSGGERARAGLALLMAREADVVLLDEPTNDLDLSTIEALEAALAATPAAVVVATHDARLVEALGAEVWTLEAGALVRWRGGLDGWRRGARRVEPGATPAGDGPADAAAGELGSAEPPAADGAEADEWERERAAAEAALGDPVRVGERERERWRARRRVAEEALIALWERGRPPPRPPLRTREAGWVVWGDASGDALEAWLDETDALARVRVRFARSEAGLVGHLVQPTADDRCLTRAARRALLRGGARLAIYARAADAVQVSAAEDPGGFEPLAPGWWVLRREALEREEGWRRADEHPAAARPTPALPPRPGRRRRRRARPARGATEGG